MTLTFVRHGETDWNRERRFQGQSDIPLNGQGRLQARAVARALARETFDSVVSSDLVRAMETARAVRTATPVKADPRWREFAFGEWEGLTWEQILQRWPERAAQGAASARSYAPPGGETFDQVRERVGEALDEMRASGVQNALIVTHAGPLHAMLHHLFSDPQADTQELLAVRFTPASITRVRLEPDGNELLLLNDVSHL
ncbi:MAG TPA: histidine phosphatase family protein [Candidatus Baltobacteraceae bacterium]|nr:histidine phosphatase family protein [Candidatus Baltobacteraceae bacterium]